MDELGKDHASALFGEAFRVMLKDIVKEAVREVLNGNQQEDRFLTAEEAAKLLSVSPDWLYHHWKELSFTRKLGRKMLRFSLQGIQKFLATRRTF